MARMLASRDQAWAALRDFESRFKLIYEEGIKTKSDEELAKVCIAAVLGELNYRKAKENNG